MRRVTQTDICAAARVVMHAPPGRRERVAWFLVACAQRADRFRRATGRHHPRHGNGTLLSAALAHEPVPVMSMPAAGSSGETEFLAAMATVIDQVLAARAAHRR